MSSVVTAMLVEAWRSRGWLACALLPVAAVFRLLSGVRRRLYRSGWLPADTLAVPVIVVGNLVVGGAGKTPTVIALVELLRRHGWHPGVISRGYGRKERQLVDVTPDAGVARSGDEPLLIHIRAAVPTVVAANRVAAARGLLQRHPDVDVVVSDDGLQHLRLPRCVDVMVFDERGAGNGWVLPAGPLREPLPKHVPPRTLVLYNAAQPSTVLPGSIARRRLAGAVSLRDWKAGAAASMDTLSTLTGRKLTAAAGMANPARFFDMLRAAGLDITPLPLSDHFDFATLPWPRHAVDVIVTEKDAVKLDADRMGTTQVWVAPLDFEFDTRFERDLIAMLPFRSPRKTHGCPPA